MFYLSNFNLWVSAYQDEKPEGLLWYTGVWNTVLKSKEAEAYPSDFLYCWADQIYECLQEDLIGCAKRQCSAYYDEETGSFY